MNALTAHWKAISNLEGCRIRQEWYDIISNIGVLLADGKFDQILKERKKFQKGKH